MRELYMYASSHESIAKPQKADGQSESPKLAPTGADFTMVFALDSCLSLLCRRLHHSYTHRHREKERKLLLALQLISVHRQLELLPARSCSNTETRHPGHRTCWHP